MSSMEALPPKYSRLTPPKSVSVSSSNSTLPFRSTNSQLSSTSSYYFSRCRLLVFTSLVLLLLLIHLVLQARPGLVEQNVKDQYHPKRTVSPENGSFAYHHHRLYSSHSKSLPLQPPFSSSSFDRLSKGSFTSTFLFFI